MGIEGMGYKGRRVGEWGKEETENCRRIKRMRRGPEEEELETNKETKIDLCVCERERERKEEKKYGEKEARELREQYFLLHAWL